MGQSLSFKLVLGTLSNWAKKSSDTPLTWRGGFSDSCINSSTMRLSKSSVVLLVLSAPACMMEKAFARLRKAAETSPGRGREWAFWGWRSPLVSTRSRVVKKVDRSGRRGGGLFFFSSSLMLCSTGKV
jgi:hypothetical protein